MILLIRGLRNSGESSKSYQAFPLWTDSKAVAIVSVRLHDGLTFSSRCRVPSLWVPQEHDTRTWLIQLRLPHMGRALVGVFSRSTRHTRYQSPPPRQAQQQRAEKRPSPAAAVVAAPQLRSGCPKIRGASARTLFPVGSVAYMNGQSYFALSLRSHPLWCVYSLFVTGTANDGTFTIPSFTRFPRFANSLCGAEEPTFIACSRIWWRSSFRS